MRDDAIAVTVRELDGKGFKDVSFWHVVLDSVLKLRRREISAPDPLEFIVGQSC